MTNANDSDAVHRAHNAPHRVAATRHLDRNWALVHEIADDGTHSRLALAYRDNAPEPVCCVSADVALPEDEWGFGVDAVFLLVDRVLQRVVEHHNSGAEFA